MILGILEFGDFGDLGILEFGYLDIWIFGYVHIWIFGILEFWENWKKITKVVFALVRSGNKDKKKLPIC